MSERKGHGNRGSLMELSKPRLAQSPLSAPIDEAERLILATGPESEAPVPKQNERELGAGIDSATGAPHPAAALQAEPERALSAYDAAFSETPPARTENDEMLARLRKRREPIAVVGFKLPAKLKDELAAVAQYNGTDMTRIVVEALERLLPGLPHPPNWSGRKPLS